KPNATDLYVRVLNVSTTTIAYNARLSTNLPTNTSFLFVHAQAGRGAGTGTATQFELLSMDLDSVIEEGVYNVRPFGALGDGIADDLPAFTLAIEAMGPAAQFKGGTLFVPAGTYKLSDNLHFTRQLILQGAAGGGGNGATRLKFATGKGIIVDRHTTAPD